MIVPEIRGQLMSARQFLVIIFAIICSGCAVDQQAELAGRVNNIKAQWAVADDQCKSKYQHPPKGRAWVLDYVKCTNDASNIMRPTMQGDLLDIIINTRIVLAEKYVAGKITVAEFSQQFSVVMSQAISEAQRRNLASRSVNAQEAEAAAASAPVSCTRFGNTTNCY